MTWAWIGIGIGVLFLGAVCILAAWVGWRVVQALEQYNEDSQGVRGPEGSDPE